MTPVKTDTDKQTPANIKKVDRIRKTVLVSPLDWGLGHATRMLTIVHLLKNDFKVTIAAEGDALSIMKKTFPQCSFVELPGFKVKYSSRLLLFRLAIQLPGFITHCIKEHLLTKKIVEKIKPSVIISDNRYGVFNKKTYNILVTHQLFLNLPRGTGFLRPFVSLALKIAAGFFNECWIPDVPGQYSLSGSLSRTDKLYGNFLHA